MANPVDLHEALLSASIPVLSVAILDAASTPPVVRVDYAPEATAQQISDGDALVAAFDWSIQAEQMRENVRLRLDAERLLSSPDGIAKLLRAASSALLDEINLIRSIIPRPIQSITRVGTTATATCFIAHGLSNGTVFITGSTQTPYNGAKAITVTGPTTFTFAVAGSPTTPATGSIVFVLATVTQLNPRTMTQVRTAIEAAITTGQVDT